MRNKTLLTLLLCAWMAAFAAAPFTASCAQAASPTVPIKLKYVTTSPIITTTPGPATYFKTGFADKVTEITKGQIIFQHVGATETISVADQGMAVKSGAVDIAMPYVGLYESLVKGIGGSILTRLTPMQERETGAYDYMLEMHKKAGLYYIGRTYPTREGYFVTWLNKEVKKPADFKGLRMGTAAAARPCVTAWGGNVVNVQTDEYYTAMDSKLVDGLAGVPVNNWLRQGGLAVTKYMIDHPYFQDSSRVIMNLNSWNKIPENLQKQMIATMIAYEEEVMAWEAADRVDYMKKIKDSKVEIVKFAPDVANWYLKTAYDSAWDFQQKRFPEQTPKLKELLTTPAK